MDKELAQLQNLLSTPREEQSGSKNFITGCIGPHEVILQKCGIGKVNAAVGAVEMIDRYHPDLIVSTGCAGGADTHLKVTDVVVGTHYTYHDVYCGEAIGHSVYGQVQGLPPRFDADPSLLEKALSLSLPKGVKVHPGLIVTGDWFVDTKDKMREIVGHFPEAKAVDMESCAIAQTCYINKVPFISFRVISDIPLRDTDASMYHDFWDNVAEQSFQVTKTFVESLQQ